MSAQPIFAVNRYIDTISPKAVRETIPDFGGKRSDRFHYFDTERDAKLFILARALERAIKAKRALIAEERRYARCLKKFGESA